jgi:two-component system chemotaxis sensor kinase CheA
LRRHAFQVDSLVGRREAVINGLSSVLPRLDAVAGTCVEPDGSVLVVLDPPTLVERAHRRQSRAATTSRPGDAPLPRRHILVVDDALTVRELQRSILLRAGFDVSVAGDGVEALTRLAAGGIDLVLTDVEMPRMDGFTLTRAIRQDPNLANLPVLIITTLDSEHHRLEGFEAGADGYIVKASFDEVALIEAVERVLGDGR